MLCPPPPPNTVKFALFIYVDRHHVELVAGQLLPTILFISALVLIKLDYGDNPGDNYKTLKQFLPRSCVVESFANESVLLEPKYNSKSLAASPK